MSQARDFFLSIVKPTVQEFLSDTRDIRRGMLAAIVLYHQSDHWHADSGAQFGSLTNRHKHLLGKCADFHVIRDVADASKHCVLDRPTAIPRELSASDGIASSLGLFEAPFGAGVFNEAVEVVVTFDDGTSRPLAPVVRSVLGMWEAEL